MSGRIIKQQRATEHRCRPPNCHEWPAGTWHIDAFRQDEWEKGDIWRCDCGAGWVVVEGLWRDWARSREHDGPATPPPEPKPKKPKKAPVPGGATVKEAVLYLLALLALIAVVVVSNIYYYHWLGK